MQSNIGARRHNVIEKDVRDAIDIFFESADWKGIYLTGGTCISEFYFGHRLSVDIDLFTQDEKLFEAARHQLMRSDFFPIGKTEAKRTLPGFCEFLLKRKKGDPIKIDLMLDIPVTLGEKVRCGKAWLDSLPDLLSNKVGCIIQRQDVKDYIDLFYLIPSLNVAAGELADIGRKKDAGMDPLILADQLTYIQRVDHAPEIFLANVPWRQIQGFFAHLRGELLNSVRA